ncbi:MAG: TetR/AcrR family transcriptional regulator [Steroidobacteraceae bacterium]
MTEHDANQRARPRKQPRQARAQQTVGAIVEATARILESYGHDGFTTNAVAELAGVSVGTLYQYFPNKQALLGALISRETALLLEDAELALAETSGPAALNRLIGAAVKHQLRRPALARLLDFEESRMPFDADRQRVRGRFQAILASLLSRPDLPQQSDPATVTADVAAIIQGVLDAAGERGETAADALRKRVRRAAIGYLRTSPSADFETSAAH